MTSNRQRVKLSLLKSIRTGTFIDVKLYAHNALCDGLPTDPKPLFASSIVIEEWAPAITTRKFKGSSYSTLTHDKEIAGIDSKPVPPVDGLIDDYEYLRQESTTILRKHQTETALVVEGREVTVLTSGAWKT